MLASFREDIVDKLVKKRNLQTTIIAAQFVVILLLAANNIILSRGLGVKLVPAQINEPLQINRDSGNAAYLKNIADYFVMLYLNITPNNNAEHINQILHYVAADDYNNLKSQLSKESKILAKHNQSRYFTPTGYEVDTASNTVLVTGDEMYVTGKKISSNIRKTYELNFKFASTGPFLTKFKVIEDD